MTKISIYGLPRTGTNYLEWMIRANCPDAYNPGPERYSIYLNGRAAEKHCAPIHHPDSVTLFIMRVDGWRESLSRWRSGLDAGKMLAQWKAHVMQLHLDPERRTILLLHDQLVKNDQFLWDQLGKWGIELPGNITRPEFYTNRDGGRTLDTSRPFITQQ